MKRMLIAIIAALVPAFGWASLALPPSSLDALQKQADLSAFSETTTMEWGCPVADLILAQNKAEALQQVRAECLAEAQRAAGSKPGVMDVLQTKVIWPDVQVLQLSEGFQLTGTFFLETTVVQRLSAEAR